MKKSLVYLACPYSHPDRKVRESRFLTATLHTGALLWDVRPSTALPVTIRARENGLVVALSRPPVELITVSDHGAVRA